MQNNIIDKDTYKTVSKLLDEEYLRIVELIEQGETHLDNLAEGFSSAARVIWKYIYLGNLESKEPIKNETTDERSTD
jgi:hypothetical protein